MLNNIFLSTSIAQSFTITPVQEKINSEKLFLHTRILFPEKNIKNYHSSRERDKILADHQKKIDTYTHFINNFDSYQEKSKKEQKKLELEIKKISGSHPGILECLMNRNRECAERYKAVEKDFLAKHLSLNLLKSVSLESLKLTVSILRNIQTEDIISSLKSAESNLEESKVILQKMLESPSEITRKEMMSLSHNLNIPGVQNKNLNALKTALSASEELSDGFPFSWHERKANDEVPDPDSQLLKENLKK